MNLKLWASQQSGRTLVISASLLLCITALTASADPVITKSRFTLDADTSYDEFDQSYDSVDEALIVTSVAEFISGTSPAVPCPESGGATITDERTATAGITAEVTPLQMTIDGNASVSWTAGSNAGCTYTHLIDPSAFSSGGIELDAGVDAAAGINYEVTVSGFLSDFSGGSIGDKFYSGSGRPAMFQGGGNFSYTYSVNMASPNFGKIAIGFNTNPDTINPDESISGDFRVRIDVRDRAAPLPPEVCDNGFDDDADGDIDGADTECPIPEICDNGLDDDLDNLIDAADPDCASSGIVGLLVRCMHKPIYPQDGEEVTITAQGIDINGDSVQSNVLEIYINDIDTPFKFTSNSSGGVGTLIAKYTPTGGSFGYGCRAEKGSEKTQSWWLAKPRLRSVDVGGANNPDWDAQPVLYSGPISEKIDIVFFHDATDYTSYLQPTFINDVHDLVNDGLWSIPWFVRNQWAFNIWIARADGADASPEPGPPPPGQTVTRCNRQNTNEIRNIFNKKYKFRDAGAIVHTRTCRNNASVPRTFTITAGSPIVLPHEMGHRPFGLSDEYCRTFSGSLICDGGHHRRLLKKFPNIYKTENGCRNNAAERPYTPDDCRLLIDPDGGTWWLGEPRYSIVPFPTQLGDPNQTRDLMQQTGSRETSPGSGNFVPAYAVGLTEITRMNWYLQKCMNGKC